MSDEQLAALAELMGSRMSPSMYAAMRDVLVKGCEQKTAAHRAGVSAGALCTRVGTAKKKLRLAYKAITGFDYQ